ncbi:MAG: methyltransferase domain-containing protein [Actinomycetota bacterium]
MRVAWFTPLPPMPSGIADYSSEIVPYIAERADVDVFCPRPRLFRRARVPSGATLRDPKRWNEVLERYDACFYHLGNNPYHEFVYRTAKDRPGIAVFHDADLHHLIAHSTFESRRDYAGYEEILREELGERGERVATLRRLGLATEFEKFVFPLTEHVASRAKGIIVHSEDSRLKMHEIAPHVPISVIPHHAGEPPAEVRSITREEARRRLGIPQDAFVVGHLGFITKPKQPGAVVGGFARLYREFPNALLYMVGADRTGGALSKLVHDLGVAPAVRLAGYVDLEQFYLHLKALDAMINLRYPSAGESSGTFARALAEGRSVIVNNYGSFAEVPGDVALKVEIDAPQPEQVGEHLLHLARERGFRLALEERAREYAGRVLDPNRCRDLYLAFGKEVGPPERSADGRPRPRRRVRPASLVEAVARRHQEIDHVTEAERAALGAAGNAVFVDLLYRSVLRRAAEDDAIRDAHAALATGALTRSELAHRVASSREFAEVRLLDDLIREVRTGAGVSFNRPIGADTTERVVEIPWMLSRRRDASRVLDVGYAFASHVWTSALLDLGIPSLHGLDPTAATVPGMRRVRGDVRGLPYRDGSFDLVYCVSTLEHVGRTGYGLEKQGGNSDDAAAKRSLVELARVLAPGGRLLLSVPFGKREDLGWMLQYDEDAWGSLVESGPMTVEEREIFRLTPAGWVQTDDLREVLGLSYGDGAPAAQAVLCATLVRRTR